MLRKLMLLLSFSMTVVLQAHAGSIAHSHMKHVYEGWGTTPNKEGFLATAFSEAHTAHAYSTLASSSNNDLKRLKELAAGVKQALTGEGDGLGLGFGFIKAAEGAIQHISFAARSVDSTSNIVEHAEFVIIYTTLSINQARQAVRSADRILSTKSLAQAKQVAQELHTFVHAMLFGSAGKSANFLTSGNGLHKALAHMTVMRANEGLL